MSSRPAFHQIPSAVLAAVLLGASAPAMGAEGVDPSTESEHGAAWTADEPAAKPRLDDGGDVGVESRQERLERWTRRTLPKKSSFDNLVRNRHEELLGEGGQKVLMGAPHEMVKDPGLKDPVSTDPARTRTERKPTPQPPVVPEPSSLLLVGSGLLGLLALRGSRRR